ncbi:Serine/threonine-protein kinase [Artomyces pyxidatus]|uniref:Serine/threonine-protein kinase n=1 Tax=Artomyces pyxidatus TaxID=48021 RepID=A0ACB8TEW7_9AGAM|nr:Serine/threonine-protein kinase [Artomyces pyxidatus]
MESTSELQQNEITVLKSIYAEDFIECPPRAWKGAVKLPEFILKISHPETAHASKIYIHLHITFPKTYPTNAYPTFTIQQPIKGLTNEQITKLSNRIHTEAKQSKGAEMVFHIGTFAQEWILANVEPPVEVVGSLATEMNRRALEEERARKQREEEEAEAEAARARQQAEAFQEQMHADAQRQQMERERQKARQRAQSDATEVPDVSEDLLTQTFEHEVIIDGLRFRTVRLYHPQKVECLGTVYQAEPVCDDANATLPLEVFIVVFDAPYYTTPQGRKKLKQVELEIKRLTTLRHVNLVSVYAVRLSQSGGAPRLAILMEQTAAFTLQDLLEECEALREDRATDYLIQIVSAMEVIHSADLVHRGLSLCSIGLVNRENGQTRLVKVGKVAYYIKLLDLHRSNPFADDVSIAVGLFSLPDTWMAKDAMDSTLIYTKGRDIHCMAVVFLQMMLGRDVVERFIDARSAVDFVGILPHLQHHVRGMLSQKRPYTSCSGILHELKEGTLMDPRDRSAWIPIIDPKTPVPFQSNGSGSSPEIDYFRVPPPKAKQVSRWKEDWEELELLGRGAFGSVVKARNKIDSRIYAVKKVRLRATKGDNKIFREVNALSRLSHRFIVRYYTTWVESSESSSTSASSDDSNSDSDTADGPMTSVRNGVKKREVSDPFRIDLDDLDSHSRSSFPSIHFTGSNESKTDESDGDVDSDEPIPDMFQRGPADTSIMSAIPRTPLPTPVSRTLYIQMEFVERQTLKERIAEGLTEDEAWRLFQQILDALVHMSSLGILHRDIKLTNIFIDGKDDCKVGDFGLATSSLAAVDPSDVSPHVALFDADMTLEVGTRLYIAPEVQSPKKGPRNHTKADMYSLGIVFFEMNYMFSTGAERIAVIEDLRKPEIFFPGDWEAHRTRQRHIINWLLQHDPDQRPTALELSQSSYLPPRIEDEYFKGALKMMTKPDSPHHQAVLAALFNQTSKGARGLLYDSEVEHPEHASLNGVVRDTLSAIFRLHGAVEMEPPLLMPATDVEDETSRVLMVDRHGEVVSLPNNGLVPFARLAARTNLRRIKRFYIGDTYRPNLVAGHPRVSKAATFDIITTDVANGSSASIAEAIIIVNDCLEMFPALAQMYELRISHSTIISLALKRIPDEVRSYVIDTVNQTKSSWAQKRALLLKKGLLRSAVDELEILVDTDEDVDVILSRLDRVSPQFVTLISSATDEMKKAIHYASLAGVGRPIYFHPLMLSSHNTYFKDGICFEAVRRHKRSDILAAGGRYYDDLISQFSPPKPRADALCAVGLQISLEKILIALASYQAVAVKNLLKEQRSFGFWSPRRCDVYIVSYQPGYLAERLEVAALLWHHNISADVMYESGLPDGEHENFLDICHREGILFSVCPRPRSARRDQPAFKVKSILKGTETDVSRQELVVWLKQQLAEQKRLDASTSGAPAILETSQGPVSTKDPGTVPDIQLVLPADVRKQTRKQTKSIYTDRAFDKAIQIQGAVQSGIVVIAIDVPTGVFDALCKSPNWIRDDEAWRTIAAMFPTSTTGYAAQVREAILQQRSQGQHFVLLYSVKEERAHLLTLS